MGKTGPTWETLVEYDVKHLFGQEWTKDDQLRSQKHKMGQI